MEELEQGSAELGGYRSLDLEALRRKVEEAAERFADGKPQIRRARRTIRGSSKPSTVEVITLESRGYLTRKGFGGRSITVLPRPRRTAIMVALSSSKRFDTPSKRREITAAMRRERQLDKAFDRDTFLEAVAQAWTKLDGRPWHAWDVLNHVVNGS